jgi:suppressor for copper-sensitivity B
VGFALSRGPVEIIVIFAALGIGMASPYLLLAAMPTFATRLPKPGAWMGWVRIAMGISLVGTVIWLLTILSAQVGLLNAGILAVLMVICGLILRLAYNGKRTSKRVSLATIGLISAIALIVPQVAPLPNSGINSGKFSQDHWQKFEVSAIGLLVEAGNTIFVDITAEWCLTCKVNKSLVLNKAKIVEQLTAPGTIAMRGDWTKPDPIIAQYLATFGRYGLPFNVIYGPGTPLGSVLPELLSEGSVVSALQQAKGMFEKDSKQQNR